ncbi:phosphotransferase family protein [Lyngbya confervoides]|uniref:Aminoglycoside phosphotransferase family protein n=1 Tax=Lyngbya confervoides BDU141951 TaxID=1574623 RepID=A0ABD4T6X2_9CYAN|nr:phosphotransferase [Lyngbya confervoides]MCM1984468.1 aminoglycoside phosphotransferase family protein [Lyngbya confervoides BDU141951]
MLAKLCDPKIPHLPEALNCNIAQLKLSEALAQPVQVSSAQLLRHKEGRRALIAYQVSIKTQEISILGKIRAKGLDQYSYQLQQTLWESGFSAINLEGLAVPEPLGLIPSWEMWLQRQVPGISLTRLLGTSVGLRIMPQVAQLAFKLHQSGIPTRKTHSIDNELSILRHRLDQLSQACPQWTKRLENLLCVCERLGQRISDLALPETLIHRDFYPDQILVEGDRLWLVDLDLCCQSHAAIDLGNFMAHIREHSLRYYASLDQLEPWIDAFLKPYLDSYQIHTCAMQPHAVGELQRLRTAIKIYTWLTLVRHISISWQISDRRGWTEHLLGYCEWSALAL